MLESISCLFFSWLLFLFFCEFTVFFPPWFVSFSSFFFLSFLLFNYRSDYLFMSWIELWKCLLTDCHSLWRDDVSCFFFFLMEPQFFLASLINVSLIFELMAINSWYLYFRSDIVSKSFCSVNCIKLVHHVLFFFQRMNSLYHMSCELYL